MKLKRSSSWGLGCEMYLWGPLSTAAMSMGWSPNLPPTPGCSTLTTAKARLIWRNAHRDRHHLCRADALQSRGLREGELCVPKWHCVPELSLGEMDLESHTTGSHVIAGVLLNLCPSGKKLKIRIWNWHRKGGPGTGYQQDRTGHVGVVCAPSAQEEMQARGSGPSSWAWASEPHRWAPGFPWFQPVPQTWEAAVTEGKWERRKKRKRTSVLIIKLIVDWLPSILWQLSEGAALQNLGFHCSFKFLHAYFPGRLWSLINETQVCARGDYSSPFESQVLEQIPWDK